MSEGWLKALSTTQITVAQRNFKVGMAQLLANAQSDPDYNNSERYYKDIEKLKTESMKGIKLPGVRSRMEMELGYESQIGRIQIESVFKKKAIDAGRAASRDLLETYSSEGDIEGIKGEIEKQRQSNLFSKEDLVKLEKSYTAKAKKNMFAMDLQNDPSVAEDRLSKNEYGFDVKELSSAKSIYDKEISKIQAVHQNELLTAYLNGEDLSPLLVKELMNQKKISPKFAESLISKIENPKPDKISQDQTYIEFQEKEMKLLENKDKSTLADIAEFMVEVMQAHSKGLLDKGDTQKILKTWSPELQERLENESEGVMQKVRPKTWFEHISFWSDEYADEKPEIKARMYRKLIDGLMQGGDGDKVLQKVVDDELELQLSDNLKKPDRLYAVNPDTKQKIHSDDGGATWFDEKGKEVK